MSSLTEKLLTYMNVTGAKPSTVARHADISTHDMEEIIAGSRQEILLSEQGWKKLESMSGIPVSIWQNDGQELPGNLLKTQRGRRKLQETSETLREQNGRHKRLAELCDLHGSKDSFAKIIGQSASGLSHYLGSRKLKDVFLRNVAKATNTSADWLLYGKGSINDPHIEYNPPTHHQGEMLSRYMDDHNINNRELGILMGYDKRFASSSVSQIRQTEQLTLKVKNRLLKALGIVETELFAKSGQTLIEQNQDLIKQSEGSSVNERHVSYINRLVAITGSGYTVTLPVIPAQMRAGVHYAHLMTQLDQLTIPAHRLKHLTTPNLTPEQQTEIIKRYAIIKIGTDYMEPAGLLPGVEAIMYQLPAEQWSDESGVMAVEKTNGRLFIGRVRQNTLASEDRLTLVADNPLGGSLLVDRDDIATLWKLETLFADIV